LSSLLEPLFVAITGLCFGSFFNVLIVRLPNDESILRPGSKCPKCGHALSWYENIPVLSWLALRGKCRACKAPISPRYVVVELLTGLLFLAFWFRFGFTWPLLLAPVLVWAIHVTVIGREPGYHGATLGAAAGIGV